MTTLNTCVYYPLIQFVLYPRFLRIENFEEIRQHRYICIL